MNDTHSPHPAGATGRAARSQDHNTDGAASEPADNDPRSRDGELVQGKRPREIGGRNGPDPVRYGDWEKNGRCIDF
jgi:hypothetical protein